MKKLMKKLAVVFAAVVMSVLAFGTTAFAEEQLSDSWVMTEQGWTFVMSDGTEAVSRLVNIDGVMYKLNSWAHQYEKYSGWTKSSDGTRRRYSKGLPYTGWLKYKSGQMRYCLDGYMATDNMQIDDHIYTFDENGFYTGKTALTLVTKCDKLVSSDADKITVTLKNLDGRDYNFGLLSNMERWEKGKWVNCYEKWVGESGEVLSYPSIGLSLENKGDMTKLDFNPQFYTNYNFTEGYYRIPIGSWIKQYKNQYESYAMFQVVPPVTVEMSEEIYLSDGISVNVSYMVTINSEKLKGSSIGYESTVYKMTENGWRDITEYTENDGTISTEQAVLEEGYSDTELIYGMPVESGIGYYKAVVKVDGQEYEDYFRIEELDAISWIDKYSNKNENLTVFLDVYNKLDRSVEINPFAYDIYRMENGKWVDAEEARIVYIEVEAGEPITLRSGEHITIKVNVSDCYDVSKLKQGEYAVYIGGLGYERFNIVNTVIDKDIYPFADLDTDKIEKIRLTEYRWTKHLKYTTRNIDDIVMWLSQVKVGEKLPSDVDMDGNIPVEVEIFYKDGTSDKIMFA